MSIVFFFFYDLFLDFWIVFHAQVEMRLPRMCTWEGLLVLIVLHSLPKCSTRIDKRKIEDVRVYKETNIKKSLICLL